MSGYDDEVMEFGNFCSSYLWTFQDFSNLGIREKEVKAPVIKFGGVEWVMGLKTSKKGKNGDFTIDASLKVESSGFYKIKVYWKTSLVSKDGTKQRMKEGEIRCVKPECIEIFKTSRNFLQNNNFLDLLPNDCLSVCLELTELDMFTCQTFWRNVPGSESHESQLCMEDLSSDILAMYLSGEQTDVVLHAGDLSFPAHKLILAARSKVFARKILQDSDGKSRYSIFVDDVEACDVKLMLEYIYSGTIPNIPIDRAYSLYASATKYEIVGLQRKCMQLITQDDFGNIVDGEITQVCKELKGTASNGLIINENTSCIYKLLRKYRVFLAFILTILFPLSSIWSDFADFLKRKLSIN